jgi:putative peptide zinc metalloprotease protein
MDNLRRWLVTALLAGGLAWTSTAAIAQEVEFGGGDNTAVAVNTKDGATRIKVSFRVVKVKGDVVDQGNAAVAVASCTDCRTIAIAWQLVLVESDPSVVTPTNLALAINIECTDCQTLASAYQWVVGTDGNVRLSDEAKRALAEMRRRLQEILRSDLSIEEIQARLDELAEEFEQLMAAELAAAAPAGATAEVVEEEGTEEDEGTEDVGVGVGVGDGGQEPDDEETPSTSPSPEGSPTTEPSPTPITESPAAPTPTTTTSP